MKVKNLFIRDFGIYKNQSMVNISPRIVVIGGKNRAGKSTLMKIIRSSAYGFVNEKYLPPASVEHEIEVEVLAQDNQYFSIRNKGKRKPYVAALNINSSSNDGDINSIRGDVDYFTYKELFTISLDELQGISKENEDLQSILLGAGLKDIMQIPSIMNGYTKEAKKIGGVSGNPSSALFKEPNTKIQDGIALKKKALSQVEQYEKDKKLLESVQYDIEEAQLAAEQTKYDLIILDLVKSNYEKYRTIIDLESSIDMKHFNKLNGVYGQYAPSMEVGKTLKKEYMDVSYEYEEKLRVFHKSIIIEEGQEVPEDISEKLIAARDSLLENEELIRESFKELSGIRQSIVSYYENKQYCIELNRRVQHEAREINEEFTNDYSRILNINTDELQYHDLCRVADLYEHYIKELRGLNKRLQELQRRKSMLQEEYNDKGSIKDVNLNLYIYIAFVFTAVGAIISFFNTVPGLILAVFGIVYIAVSNISRLRKDGGNKSLKENVDFQIKTIGIEIIQVRDEIAKVTDQLKLVEEDFKNYKAMLKLYGEITAQGIKDYFKLVKAIKEKINDLRVSIEDVEHQSREINNRLEKIKSICSKFQGTLIDDIPDDSNGMLIDFSEQLSSNITSLYNHLSMAQEINVLEKQKNKLEEKIIEYMRSNKIGHKPQEVALYLQQYLNNLKAFYDFKEINSKSNSIKAQVSALLKSNHAKKALESRLSKNLSEDQLEKGFYEIISQYASNEEIEREYKVLDKKVNDKEREVKELEEHRRYLIEEVKRLSSIEMLEKAQTLIEDGRRELGNLAEKFAVYSSASFLMTKVQERFLDKAKSSLLKGASEVLKSITSGEYERIEPSDNLSSLEFKTVMENGEKNENVNILSRGTREQLFLSVRISRIKDIKPSMPVILDDSLVNFDREHLINTIKVISDLSATNQIFILTCHPQIVEVVEERCMDAQYFGVNKGIIKPTTYKDLREYLYK